ncbi:SDR family NAD(P)-dependent oxidoreductase [Synechococcus sp. CCY9202]|uniref:SDR family NAD(P)-dependent oxidoreductase n=1 Tax=Synechococcus sp. CCY9202 TaxID=174698 RepID=UPI002B20E0BA|nr:SDR family oxidoreductase [Synechococcus sp. CCY9202]MEA5422648.1 SDR family oxidoreductase [Synechococcus sp. CCY9202]
MFSLASRVAVITGGNGGIGLGIATGLAKAGAHVVIAARDAAKSESALRTLSAIDLEAMAIQTDVTDEHAVTELMRQIERRHGRLDILVNNAGITIRAPAQDLSLAEWNDVICTNLSSTFLCARAAYPLMKRSGGKIINIGSMLSIFGASFSAAYGASKGGILQLTKSLAVAWAPDNIQVNAVLPGWIDTDLTRAGRTQIPGLHEQVLARTPAGRWGTPDDLEGVAVFLASAASNYITGAAIPVDGGFSSSI